MKAKTKAADVLPTIDGIKEAIDAAIAPDVMSKSEALEFLLELTSDLESQIQCLRDEVDAEDE